jgi:hypothetical protein
VSLPIPWPNVSGKAVILLFTRLLRPYIDMREHRQKEGGAPLSAGR